MHPYQCILYPKKENMKICLAHLVYHYLSKKSTLFFMAGLCPAPHKLLKKLEQNFCLFPSPPRREKRCFHLNTPPRPNKKGRPMAAPTIYISIALAGQAFFFLARKKNQKRAVICKNKKLHLQCCHWG